MNSEARVMCEILNTGIKRILRYPFQKELRTRKKGGGQWKHELTTV
jgi:hypothetical protein